MGEKFDTPSGVAGIAVADDAPPAPTGSAATGPMDDTALADQPATGQAMGDDESTAQPERRAEQQAEPLGERAFPDGYTMRRYAGGRITLTAPDGSEATWHGGTDHAALTAAMSGAEDVGWFGADGTPMPPGWGLPHAPGDFGWADPANQ